MQWLKTAVLKLLRYLSLPGGVIQVERQQDNIVRAFQPEDLQVTVEKERLAQTARERSAIQHVQKYMAARASPPVGAPAALNMFVSKTKALLVENWSKSPPQQLNGQWVCRLSYSSVLRSLHGQGSANDKKSAKAMAADTLLRDINSII